LSINFRLPLVLLLAIAVPALPASAQNSTLTDNDTDPWSVENVMINEVELNPIGDDLDREWIELYNPSGTEVNISDFEITTSFKPAAIRLPQGAGIEANDTYVVELSTQMLSNTAESLVLEDRLGKVIDTTPSIVDWSDDDRTWQRIPDGDNEWHFAAGTKGELNDPDGHAAAARSARLGSIECQGKAGCVDGIVTRIVDGDTLYVGFNGATYTVDLAIASAPLTTESG
jgi:hypothetical protein